MPPMWWKLIKIVLLLFALFTTIVCINSEMSKRREAEAEAEAAAAVNNSSINMTPFLSDNLLNIMRNKAQEQEQENGQKQQPQKEEEQQHQPAEVELTAEDIDERILSLFKVHAGDGVTLFNTTTTDDASFMPIPTMLGDQPAAQSQPENESWLQTHSQFETQSDPKPKHYHQYQSMNHQQQSFKVQRSPDGKLNLVFNDPLVSLQSTEQKPQQQQPLPPRRPTSDTFVFPDSIDKYRPSLIDLGDHQCVDGFNQSRSFCTKVSNYPDLSGLKGALDKRFANFFSDEPQPTELGLRTNVNSDEQYLCKSHVRFLYPKLGQRLDQTWQYIVNTDEFKQGILIEECENEGESCQFLDSFPNNYKPICKQHYVTRHLATINNASNGTPELANEPFKIPSCCKCVIKSTFSINSSP